MKKVIGGLVAGLIGGCAFMTVLFSVGLDKTCERGPVVYEDDDIKVKRGLFNDGQLSNLAWVTDKKSEK